MTYKRKVYQAIASLLVARQNCIEFRNTEWLERHTDNIDKLVSEFMPHGSGWDSGTKIDLESSMPDKLVFTSDYHHMDNNNGSYDGWSSHVITVTPSLAFEIEIDITPDIEYSQDKIDEYNEAVADNCNCDREGLDSEDHVIGCPVEDIYCHDHELFLEFAYDDFYHCLTLEVTHDENGFTLVKNRS